MSIKPRKAIGIIALICTLFACADEHHYAPVSEVGQSVPASGQYVAVSGDTLYGIAWRFGMDYRQLAKRNQISAPYTILPGQKLALQHSSSLSSQEVTTDTSSRTLNIEESKQGWTWPVMGPLLKNYSSAHKSINVGGVEGTPILAAANGKVVYCGNGLKWYGNLIILKHSNVYLSAYAHNKTLFVKEGQLVKQGEIIAEMGRADTGVPMLHFEIRKAGIPINPMSLLKSPEISQEKNSDFHNRLTTIAQKWANLTWLENVGWIRNVFCSVIHPV